MEKNKKIKISLGMAICIFIIILLLLTLIGTIIYYNYISKEKTTQSEVDNNKNNMIVANEKTNIITNNTKQNEVNDNKNEEMNKKIDTNKEEKISNNYEEEDSYIEEKNFNNYDEQDLHIAAVNTMIETEKNCIIETVLMEIPLVYDFENESIDAKKIDIILDILKEKYKDAMYNQDMETITVVGEYGTYKYKIDGMYINFIEE